MQNNTRVSVETTVQASAEKVWKYWTAPEHIVKWNSASDDWHTPRATVDLKEGGTFNSRMEAKDGSVGFDFAGVFTKVVPQKTLEYTMGDGRKVSIIFEDQKDKTRILETFETESENPIEMQRQGWQSIMDNFKKYTEAHA